MKIWKVLFELYATTEVFRLSERRFAVLALKVIDRAYQYISEGHACASSIRFAVHLVLSVNLLPPYPFSRAGCTSLCLCSRSSLSSSSPLFLLKIAVPWLGKAPAHCLLLDIRKIPVTNRTGARPLSLSLHRIYFQYSKGRSEELQQ